MCFSLQRRVLLATAAYNFSTSELPRVLRGCQFFSIFTWTCVSRHSNVQFFLSPLTTWLRTRRFSEPAFRPSRPTNHRKNTASRDFPNMLCVCIFFLLTFAQLYRLSSVCTSLLCFSSSDSTSLLCLSTLHIVGSFTSKLPLIRVSYDPFNRISTKVTRSSWNFGSLWLSHLSSRLFARKPMWQRPRTIVNKTLCLESGHFFRVCSWPARFDSKKSKNQFGEGFLLTLRISWHPPIERIWICKGFRDPSFEIPWFLGQCFWFANCLVTLPHCLRWIPRDMTNQFGFGIRIVSLHRDCRDAVHYDHQTPFVVACWTSYLIAMAYTPPSQTYLNICKYI